MSREERLDRDYLECLGLDYDSLDVSIRSNYTLRGYLDIFKKQNDTMKVRMIVFHHVRTGKTWHEGQASMMLIRYGKICSKNLINGYKKSASLLIEQEELNKAA